MILCSATHRFLSSFGVCVEGGISSCHCKKENHCWRVYLERRNEEMCVDDHVLFCCQGVVVSLLSEQSFRLHEEFVLRCHRCNAEREKKTFNQLNYRTETSRTDQIMISETCSFSFALLRRVKCWQQLCYCCCLKIDFILFSSTLSLSAKDERKKPQMKMTNEKWAVQSAIWVTEICSR